MNLGQCHLKMKLIKSVGHSLSFFIDADKVIEFGMYVVTLDRTLQ